MTDSNPITGALYGDGPNVRPVLGIEALRLVGSLEAVRGDDGVWAVALELEDADDQA